ncbi:MAG: hypothetical protein ACE5F6_07975 [Anaerolineae bacterium]
MKIEKLIDVPGPVHGRITTDARPPMKSAGYTTAPHEWGFPGAKTVPQPDSSGVVV